MSTQIVRRNEERAEVEGAAKSLWARVRAAVADSAWGSLVGKGLVYIAGFALLAMVGSGRVHCLAGPRPGPGAAVAAAPSPSASAMAAAGVASAAPSSQPDVGAATDAGTPPPASKEAEAANGGAGGGLTPEGKVVLNRATEEDLRHLPGIGATRARAILALRAKLGRFSRVEDLLRVKGIGRRSLARLRPKVLLD
jgi:competence protein ComEA